MIEFAESPVVLAVRQRGGELVLRIDSNLWNLELDRSDAVRIVTLHAAQVSTGEDPATWVGHDISLHTNAEDDRSVAEIYINYAVDYIEVACSAVSEERAPYSAEDIASKLAA